MADKLALTVVTPRGFVSPQGFTGKPRDGIEVDEVTATGISGEFGVLPGHVPFLTYLKPGALQFRQDGADCGGSHGPLRITDREGDRDRLRGL